MLTDGNLEAIDSMWTNGEMYELGNMPIDNGTLANDKTLARHEMWVNDEVKQLEKMWADLRELRGLVEPLRIGRRQVLCMESASFGMPPPGAPKSTPEILECSFGHLRDAPLQPMSNHMCPEAALKGYRRRFKEHRRRFKEINEQIQGV